MKLNSITGKSTARLSEKLTWLPAFNLILLLSMEIALDGCELWTFVTEDRKS